MPSTASPRSNPPCAPSITARLCRHHRRKPIQKSHRWPISSMTIRQSYLNIRIHARSGAFKKDNRITFIMRRYFLVLLCTLPLADNTAAVTLQLPPADVDVVGQVEFTEASRDDTLLDIARRYDIGQNEILLANPKVDRWLPEDGSESRSRIATFSPGRNVTDWCSICRKCACTTIPNRYAASSRL